VPKDSETTKFMVSTPILPEKVVFEGVLLGIIPSLKLEDWDLVDQEKFPRLALNKYLVKIYYEETRVMRVELMKWVVGFEKTCLLNMLWVPHFNKTNVNTVCVRKFITFVHDGCLWLG